MRKMMLDIPEVEAANIESALDNLLTALRRLDEEHEPRWEEIERLKAETHLMMDQLSTTMERGKVRSVDQRL